MIKKLIKNKRFLILLIIVFILLIIKLISSNSADNNQSLNNLSKDQQNSSSNPKSNTTFNPTPTIKITEVNYQVPLTKYLPYTGKYFKATRYFKANNIEIKVFNKENTDLAKQEAQEWLVKNGVDKLDTFTVIY